VLFKKKKNLGVKMAAKKSRKRGKSESDSDDYNTMEYEEV